MSSAALVIRSHLADRTAEQPHFSLGYRPALDGLRGIAILIVLGVHTIHLFGWPILMGGNLGVDVFFTLSGFLITTLLLQEWDRTSSINLWNFYLRRILRLIPALVLLLLILFFLSDALFDSDLASQTRGAIPIAFVYASDFAVAFFQNARLGALQHTWSLAIEEHFYLIWPLMMLAALKLGLSKKGLLAMAIGLSLAAAINRAVLWNLGATPVRTYYGIDARADALLIGCAAGIAVTLGVVLSVRWLATPAVLLLLLLTLSTDYASPVMHVGGFTLVAVATALLIVNATGAPGAISHFVLESRLLVWIGKISYGIYLWHYPVFKMMGSFTLDWPIKLVLAIVVTVLVSATSYYLIEAPALRLKSRLCSA